MTVPLERQRNIADVKVRVREQLGLGSAALSDATAFATAAQGENADNALPAFKSRSSVVDAIAAGKRIPDAFETLSYAVLGDGGGTKWVHSQVEPFGFEGSVLTNADFYEGTKFWTLGSGWALAGESARKVNKTPGAITVLQQSTFENLITGATYEIEFEVTDRTNGLIVPSLSGGATVSGVAVTANGVSRQRIVATAGSNAVVFTPDANFDGALTRIYCRRVVVLPSFAKIANPANDAFPWYWAVPTEILPEMCGAVGDGLPSSAPVNQAAFSACIDWMQYTKTPLRLPAKTYYLVGNSERGALHTQRGEFFVIRGEGYYSRLRMQGSYYAAVIGIQGGENIVLEDFSVDGNSQNAPQLDKGNGILFYNGNVKTPVRNVRCSNITVENTVSYGFALQNLPVKNFKSVGLTVINSGTDGVDIKPYAAVGEEFFKEDVQFISTSIVNPGVRFSDGLTKTGMDIRGHVIADGIHVTKLKSNSGIAPMGVRVSPKVNSNSMRQGGDMSQIDNVYVEYDVDGPPQTSANGATGVACYDRNTNWGSVITNGCRRGVLVGVSGVPDSVPVETNFGLVHVINARASDGSGIGIQLTASGVDLTNFTRAVVENADLGAASNSRVSGNFLFSNCAKGHSFSTAILQNGFLTFQFINCTTNADVADMNIVTATPTVVVSTEPAIHRLYRTKNGGWTSGEVVGAYEFFSADESGVGPGVRAAIRAIMTGVSGGATAIALYAGATARDQKVLEMSDASAYFNPSSIPVYADDTAAGAAGLTSGRIYKTSSGSLQIKS
ncbi:hypothetical protein [Agrobacterium tumefaciens]|uniref:hypothetical protein n=1 Tax=Agrobacterium tumefaciens TaxID=358 RepID=UPI00157434ED|nr:hypothetical protein [Agrobacterium tumefaciens]